MFNKKSAFVGEKNLDVIKMHGTTIKIIEGHSTYFALRYGTDFPLKYMYG